MEENKFYLIIEGIICLVTAYFIWKLEQYNQLLHEIQVRYPNMIQQTMEIAGEPNYFKYLLGGAFFIGLLIVYTIFVSNLG
ncbi:hypothetical protein [Enterococcus rivorum]|uniref:hypothetical protein n=1 Tax=Enterococcus rivorum TaxID=762845 RepID=UPI00362E1359